MHEILKNFDSYLYMIAESKWKVSKICLYNNQNRGNVQVSERWLVSWISIICQVTLVDMKHGGQRKPYISRDPTKTVKTLFQKFQILLCCMIVTRCCRAVSFARCFQLHSRWFRMNNECSLTSKPSHDRFLTFRKKVIEKKHAKKPSAECCNGPFEFHLFTPYLTILTTDCYTMNNCMGYVKQKK